MLKPPPLLFWICLVTVLSVGCKKQKAEYKEGQLSAKPTRKEKQTKQTTPKEQILDPKVLVGTYEYNSGPFKTQYVFAEEGRVTNYRNGEKTWEGFWASKGKQVMITKTSGSALVFGLEEGKSLTHLANVKDGKRVDLEELYQATYQKVEDQPAEPQPVTPKESKTVADRKAWAGNYKSTSKDDDILMGLNETGVVRFSSESGTNPDKGIWTVRNETIVVMTGIRKMVFQKLPDETLSQIATITANAQIMPVKEGEKRLQFRKSD